MWTGFKAIYNCYQVWSNYYVSLRKVCCTIISLAPSDQGDSAAAALQTSLSNLQLDYLDLYLIHWPGVSGIPTNHSDNRVRRQASWSALVRCKEKRLVRDIGVSNYTVRHLVELLDDCQGVIPAVNQVL